MSKFIERKLTLERVQKLLTEKAQHARIQMETSSKKTDWDFNCGLWLGFDLAHRLIEMVIRHQGKR